MITIEESGMKFGPFRESHCFPIENSPLHTSAQPGIRIAEFLLVQDGRGQAPVQVWIIEAKQSSPDPESPLPDAAERFDSFVDEVREKLLNAMTLGVTACLGRHAGSGQVLPDAFRSLPLDRTDFRFVLVVNGHKSEWLPPLQDKLEGALRIASRTWGLGAGCVVVLNDALARRRGLIA